MKKKNKILIQPLIDITNSFSFLSYWFRNWTERMLPPVKMVYPDPPGLKDQRVYREYPDFQGPRVSPGIGACQGWQGHQVRRQNVSNKMSTVTYRVWFVFHNIVTLLNHFIYNYVTKSFWNNKKRILISLMNTNHLLAKILSNVELYFYYNMSICVGFQFKKEFKLFKCKLYILLRTMFSIMS